MILRKYQKGENNFRLPKLLVSDNTNINIPSIKYQKDLDLRFSAEKDNLLNKAYQQLKAGNITEKQYQDVLNNNKATSNRLSNNKLLNTSKKIVKKAEVKYKKEEKEAETKLNKELWKDYKDAPFVDKVMDRAKAVITEPLLMSANFLSGKQAYIPGMAGGLNDQSNPDYKKYLSLTNQPEGGTTVNNLFKMVNPGAWGYHSGTEVNKGNYLAGYGELLGNAAGLIAGGPMVTGESSVAALNATKKLPQHFFYNAIDPVGYGVKAKILKAPITLTQNLIYPETRPERVAKLFVKPGSTRPIDARLGMNRLDAFRTGLGLEQKYNTFVKDGSKYAIKNFEMGPEEKSFYISDIEAFNAKQNLTGSKLKTRLREISRNEDLNSRQHTRKFLEQHGALPDFLNKPVSSFDPWEQTRAVEISKDPNYDFSIYSADNHGIMGGYRMDVKQMPDGTYKFKAHDTWDLHPTRGDSKINLNQENKKINFVKKKLENLEFLKLMGGKPFEIENKFTHKMFDVAPMQKIDNPYRSLSSDKSFEELLNKVNFNNLTIKNYQKIDRKNLLNNK